MATTVETAMKKADHDNCGRVPVVAVERLEKTFGRHKVLNGLSLAINRGETLAVLGRSGTGKSVLLRVIIGLRTTGRRDSAHSRAGHRGSWP